MGVPQGDILNEIPKIIKTSQFYSDFTPFSKCRNTVERAVNTIKQNLYNIGLELVPEKTVLIQFNIKLIDPGQTSVTIDNIEIKSSEQSASLASNLIISSLLSRM
ncbi:hypothetical protein TSAR_015102 [Trichomalopsis sarcophagae]|uniref:Uncharacterized protein n=1 Tax=Trichomalopsis sarcophagae TaxID=543379 RepID=A0A232ENQ6_9HYME|nr:hypothetical protein TSAR_015102 [Trichomalopsis sarcophagae]